MELLSPTEPAVQANLGRCPQCGEFGIKREKRPNGNDMCSNGHTYPSSEAVTGPIEPEDFFRDLGLEVKHVKAGPFEGLLAFVTNKPCANPWGIFRVPVVEDGPAKGAIYTCLCDNRRELMVAVTTAINMARYMNAERDFAEII